MSPPPRAQATPSWGFPRVSGDEPELGGDINDFVEFSPRERG